MKRKSVLLVIVVLSALIISPAWKQQQDKRDIAAYVIKVVKSVSKKAGGSTGWQQAIPADVLKSGHQVRTDANSLALIRFSDETKLLVREKSEVEIKGTVQGKQILDRNVHTTRGNVGFDVKKQEKESFRFSSPISVASIRGTSGAYIRQDDTNTDQLTIGNGLATLTNLVSNQSIDVGSSQTGVVDDKGNIAVHQSTTQENGQSGTSIPGRDETAGPEAQKQKHELRFTAEDKSGSRKTVVITWEE